MKSTKDKPLQFFYDFFQKGIFADRKKFLEQDPNYEDSYLKIIEINKEKEYIKTIVWEEEEGRGLENYSYYKDVLSSLLSEQVKLSIGLIESQVKEISRAGNNFYFYLDAVLVDLNEIKDIVKKLKISTKYDSCIVSIYEIASYLIKNYPNHFEKNKSPVIAETEEYMKGIIADINSINAKRLEQERRRKNKITAFQWKDENPGNTLLLYECLKNIAIKNESDTLGKIKLAFSGEEIKEPLKIKWIFLKNGKHPKPSLIRVFNMLINDLKIVAPVSGNPEIANKLEYIFVDQNGKPIQNIKNVFKNNAEAKNLTSLEKRLLQSIRDKFNSDK
jgi:hypothetical protein